jgi:hypothetical protein
LLAEGKAEEFKAIVNRLQNPLIKPIPIKNVGFFGRFKKYSIGGRLN